MAPVACRGRQARPEGLGKKKWEDTQGNLRGGGRFSLSGKRGWCPISQPEGPAPPSPPRADNTSLSHVPDANSSPHHLGAQHLPSPPATSSTSLTSSAQSHQLSSSLTDTDTFLYHLSQPAPSFASYIHSQELSSLPDTSQTPSSPTCDSHLPGPPVGVTANTLPYHWIETSTCPPHP